MGMFYVVAYLFRYALRDQRVPLMFPRPSTSKVPYNDIPISAGK
jgi:hypothetical protein